MTMLNHLSAFADRTIRANLPQRPRYAVSLIDRLSGRAHVIAGVPLVVLTTTPRQTSQDLMRDRDPMRWETTAARMTGTEVAR